MGLTFTRRVFFALSACLALAGPASADAAADEARYIVIGNTVGEIVAALQPQGKVVAVGSGMDQIGAFSGLPVIRGFRLSSAENLLSLRPTLVVIAGRQTRPELITQLRTAGVSVEVVPDGQSKADALANIARLGELLDRAQAAQKLAEDLGRDWDAAIENAQENATGLGGMFILSGGGRPTVAGGRGTFPALLIGWAGGRNLAGEIEGYKPLSQEAIAVLAPDFIIANQEAYDEEGGQMALLQAKGIEMTPAWRERNLITLPSGSLTGAGLATPAAINALSAELSRIKAAR